VGGLVLEFGGDTDQAVAGLLHDVLEDCEGVDEEMLRARFGSEATRIVAACSDVLEGDTPGKKSPWLDRKRRYIDHLRRADARVRLVSACDKLDNLRSMVADLDADGPATLDRFSGSPRQIHWYYREVRNALGSDLPERLLAELDALVERFAAHVPEASSEP
jgi:(p)ppGpp synthase/HD superfamily hydrolase